MKSTIKSNNLSRKTQGKLLRMSLISAALWKLKGNSTVIISFLKAKLLFRTQGKANIHTFTPDVCLTKLWLEILKRAFKCSSDTNWSVRCPKVTRHHDSSVFTVWCPQVVLLNFYFTCVLPIWEKLCKYNFYVKKWHRHQPLFPTQLKCLSFCWSNGSLEIKHQKPRKDRTNLCGQPAARFIQL